MISGPVSFSKMHCALRLHLPAERRVGGEGRQFPESVREEETRGRWQVAANKPCCGKERLIPREICENEEAEQASRALCRA